VYRIQPGDELAVYVTPQKGYDTEGSVVLPDGALYLKQVGKVQAEGMTLDELNTHVEKQLVQVHRLKTPRVLVNLVKRAPPPPPELEKPVKLGKVTVTGAVLKPGPLDLEPDLRVRKAIDLAGGVDKDADLANIQIVHKSLRRSTVDLSTIDKVVNPDLNIKLEDGDSIQVPLLPTREQGFVRISGEVEKPNQYELKPDMIVQDLIAAAGGTSPLADMEHVQIARKGRQVQTINLIEQEREGPRARVYLEPGDEVFVPEHKEFVVLIGALTKPGPRALQPGETISDFFVTRAEEIGGLHGQIVNMSGVQIRRGKDTIKVNLKEVLVKEGRKDNVVLQSKDVIFLPSKKDAKKGFMDYIGQIGSLGFLLGL
jgi:protein involved in polysaccharide export with SLBB domain